MVVNALADYHNNVALRAFESRVLTHHGFHMAGDRKKTASPAGAAWATPQILPVGRWAAWV